jgi:hypothetical protein
MIKRAMDIHENVYLTPADNRDDLVRRIVAVCEQIPPEFLLSAAAMGVSGRIEYALERMGVISNICYSKVMVT